MTKATLLRIHRYAGLFAALFLFVQALTGCLLVYRDAAARLIDPAGMQRETMDGKAPLANILSAARSVEPGAAIERVNYPASKQATYLVRMHNAAGELRFACGMADYGLFRWRRRCCSIIPGLPEKPVRPWSFFPVFAC